MNLKQYLADDDPNKWYRLGSGEMENLFDESQYENDRLRAALNELYYYFKSGNHIKVTQARIKTKSFMKIYNKALKGGN